MKIIELLNRIANNEDVPKKIKFKGLIYTWDKIGYLHYKDDYYRECSLLEGLRVEPVLNARVEIIEDEEEIDIPNIEDLGVSSNNVGGKIAELIKAVKQLDKKVNSIEQK